mmetsp:Transcript_21074/g.45237  ORF Transcript_21074/g.45237 Transcript_21074/m.45237 type:complete len:314 (-) Transcript_21074:330-1271(-)
MAGSRIFATWVKPGKDCKVKLPPCSALEIKNAALSTSSGSPSERCVLECDLATHSFVLCSLAPGGPRQAALGTVITNDPSEPAWLFLKARGPCGFHVLGRLMVETHVPVAGISTGMRDAEETHATSELDLGDSGWGLGSPVRSSGKLQMPGTADEEPLDALGDEEADIDVLLPPGGDEVEYPSDADSEDFVRWMQARANQPRGDSTTAKTPGKAAAGGKHSVSASGKSGAVPSTLAESEDAAATGGSASGESKALRGGGRSARRRASWRRQQLGGGGGDDAGSTNDDDGEEPPSKRRATEKPRRVAGGRQPRS